MKTITLGLLSLTALTVGSTGLAMDFFKDERAKKSFQNLMNMRKAVREKQQSCDLSRKHSYKEIPDMGGDSGSGHGGFGGHGLRFIFIGKMILPLPKR